MATAKSTIVTTGLALLLVAGAHSGEVSHVVAPASAQDDRDRNIAVQITTPRPGEHLRGAVVISGFAGDLRSLEGTGLNERDIQLWLRDSSNATTQLGFAGGGRLSLDAMAALGAGFQFA